MKFPVFQRLQWESGQLQRLKGLVGGKLSRVCLLKVEEHGTCCLVKILKSRSVLIRLTCRKLDSYPDKKGSRGTLAAWMVVPSEGGSTTAYFDQSSTSPGSSPESSTVLWENAVIPLCRLREGNVQQEEHFAGDFGAYGRSLHCTLFFSRHLTLL